MHFNNRLNKNFNGPQVYGGFLLVKCHTVYCIVILNILHGQILKKS
jgi:hypothetical protein